METVGFPKPCYVYAPSKLHGVASRKTVIQQSFLQNVQL